MVADDVVLKVIKTGIWKEASQFPRGTASSDRIPCNGDQAKRDGGWSVVRMMDTSVVNISSTGCT